MQNNLTTFNVKEFAESLEIFDICETIGEQFGLHIDQVSELDSEIRGIILEELKSSDFIDHIKTRLEIDSDTAQKIATEVNSKIFVALKEKIQSASPVQPKPDTIPNETKPPTETKPPHITDLEKAGGFTIEHTSDIGQNGEGIGSDVMRIAHIKDKWTPVQQTVVPTGTPIPAPKIENPVPQKTPTPPIQTVPTPTITETPKTITPNTELPAQNIAGVSSTVLNPGSWPTKNSVDLPNMKSTIASNEIIEPKQPIPDIVTKPTEPELPKTKEPLADQLLSMLNRPKQSEPTKEEKVTPIPPVNLPVQEITNIETKETTNKTEDSKSTDEEIPVFNLDSYITKTNNIGEAKINPIPTPPSPEPVNIEVEIKKSVPTTPSTPIPPPIPVSPLKNNPMPISQPPKSRGSDPYREPIQ